MQEKFARPLGLMVLPVRHRIFRDVAADQPYLAVFDLGVGVLEAADAFTQTFHFRTRQRDAALDAVEDVVVVKRPLVSANELDTFFRVAVFPVACHRSYSRRHVNRTASMRNLSSAPPVCVYRLPAHFQ